jgi:ubiquitin-like 1-activating enzyme E1 B
MPVHTIVWAKELYKLLCHSKVEESMLYEDEEGDEPSTYMEAAKKVRKLIEGPDTSTTSNSNNSQDLTSAGVALLKGLYHTEIQKQLDMGRYKAAKKTPTPLETSIIEGTTAEDNPSRNNTTAIWSIQECLAEFQHLLQQAAAADSSEIIESFDKDDDLAMRFVSAASNLRSHVFGIEPLQSIYSAKGIAGNIIPAIATTNAICAGLQILQAFRVLKAKLSEPAQSLKETCQYINCIRNKTRNGLYLTASTLEAPNPNCFVCRNAVIPLQINIEQWTLENFIKTIVKGRLGFEAPTLLLEGDFIWEEGDGADSSEYEPNLAKTLLKLPCGGIHNGTVLEIDDATQNLTIQISVTHQEVWEGDQAELEYPFLVGAAPKATAVTVKPEAAADAKDNDDDSDDIVVVSDDKKEDVVMLLDSDDEGEPAAKRPASEANGEPRAKKQKTHIEIIE